MTVNVVLGDRRSRSRRELRETSVEATRGPSRISPDKTVDLERAIAALPPRARQVLVLFDVHGYTHEETSKLLGITTGASKSQLNRARRLIREALAR